MIWQTLKWVAHIRKDLGKGGNGKRDSLLRAFRLTNLQSLPLLVLTNDPSFYGLGKEGRKV